MCDLTMTCTHILGFLCFGLEKKKITIVKDGCVHCAKIQTDQTAADKHETNHENQLYTDVYCQR